MNYSACIEMLFSRECENFVDRISRAKSVGFDAVEFWTWKDKNIDAIEEAIQLSAIPVSAMVAEPMIALTDLSNQGQFLEGLAQSIEVAQRLNAPTLIAQAGDDLEGHTRDEQFDALVSTLSKAADVLRGTGVQLALEPLNDRIDHPGYFLHSTVTGLDIVDVVARSEIGLLYDLYHSMVMDEVPEHVVGSRAHRILHVHLADHPGRNEPGSGALDIRTSLHWLVEQGYKGTVGFEFKPTGDTVAAVDAAFTLLK